MERILSCRDVVRCLAIEDTLQQSGMPILYAMARAVVEQRGGTVLVVLTEGSGAPWTSMGHQQKVHVIDARNDIARGKSLLNILEGDAVRNARATTARSPTTTTLLIIDSLNPFLYFAAGTSREVIRELGQFMRRHCGAEEHDAALSLSLVVGLHVDDADKVHVARHLSTVSTATLRVSNLRRHIDSQHTVDYMALQAVNATATSENGRWRSLSPTDQSTCEAQLALEVRKRSGKVLHETNVFRTVDASANSKESPSFALTPLSAFVNAAQPVQADAKASTKSASSDLAADITSDLSFSLRLTEKQVAARAEVDLPYMRVQREEKALESVIFYQPDAADDFDDEDPDDDLGI